MTLKHGHPWMCCLTASYIATYSNATDLPYHDQAFSSLHKHDNHVHVATSVEVRENIVSSSQSTRRTLANWQQAHVVIEIYY